MLRASKKAAFLPILVKGMRENEWILNKADLAELIGVSTQTLDNWRQRGLPIVAQQKTGRGATWQADARAVVQWLKATLENKPRTGFNVQDQDEYKTRKMKSDAEQAELDLAERLGQVVLIKDVERELENEFAKVKSRLMAIPVKLAPMLAPEDDPNVCQEILQQQVMEALSELSADSEEDFQEEGSQSGEPEQVQTESGLSSGEPGWDEGLPPASA